MAEIKTLTRRVYMAPTSGRCFFTSKAACRREASDMVRSKYPNEGAYFEGGIMIYEGWSFHENPHLGKVRDRLAKMLIRRIPA